VTDPDGAITAAAEIAPALRRIVANNHKRLAARSAAVRVPTAGALAAVARMAGRPVGGVEADATAEPKEEVPTSAAAAATGRTGRIGQGEHDEKDDGDTGHKADGERH
jgi:hypothetical protein